MRRSTALINIISNYCRQAGTCCWRRLILPIQLSPRVLGLDRTSGGRRWQRRLETTHTFDKWLVHPTTDVIFVAVCRWNEDLCRFLVLDPETGVSRAETRHEFGGNQDGGVWLNERAYKHRQCILRG